MNKTTEALKLAEEALVMYCEHGAIFKPNETLAAIREALAKPDIEEMTLTQIASRHEPVKQECHELTHDQYLALAKDADILTAHEHCHLDELEMKKAWVVEYGKLVYAKAWLDGLGSIQPVKQEPVAWMDSHGNVKNNEEINDYITAGWGKDKVATYSIPLYAAPVGAEHFLKAIAALREGIATCRAEALEEAAKVAEETIASVINKPMPLKNIVAAIRGLK